MSGTGPKLTFARCRFRGAGKGGVRVPLLHARLAPPILVLHSTNCLLEGQRVAAARPEERPEFPNSFWSYSPVPSERPITGMSSPEVVGGGATWSPLCTRCSHEWRPRSAAPARRLPNDRCFAHGKRTLQGVPSVRNPSPLAVLELPDGRKEAVLSPICTSPWTGVNGHSTVARNISAVWGPLRRCRRILSSLQEVAGPNCLRSEHHRVWVCVRSGSRPSTLDLRIAAVGPLSINRCWRCWGYGSEQEEQHHWTSILRGIRRCDGNALWEERTGVPNGLLMTPNVCFG